MVLLREDGINKSEPARRMSIDEKEVHLRIIPSKDSHQSP
jgi:hypothetical protein